MELSDQMEYQIIKDKAMDSANGYVGATKVKADQCIDSIGTLWRYFALLSEVVEKANELYKKDSFLKDTEAEALELLETSPIVMETEKIAISERSLLSGENKEKRATPRQLLIYMQECFESVSRAVAEIFKASETVDNRINNIKAEIDNLNSRAQYLRLNRVPAFDLDKLTEAERNPLQALRTLDSLSCSVEKFKADLQSLEKDYDQVIEAFGRVRNILTELKALAAKSQEAASKSLELFNNKIKPTIGADIIKSLEDWLRTLENKLGEGFLEAVKIGVNRLEQECLMKLKVERENYFENFRDYNEWLDLKGQFKALCAKAEVLRARGLNLHYGLQEQMEVTRAALYADKINLEECRQLIRKFELSLKSR
jgi:hypothetical protein